MMQKRNVAPLDTPKPRASTLRLVTGGATADGKEGDRDKAAQPLPPGSAWEPAGTITAGPPARVPPGETENVCPYCGGSASDYLMGDSDRGEPLSRKLVCRSCGPLTIIDLDPGGDRDEPAVDRESVDRDTTTSSPAPPAHDTARVAPPADTSPEEPQTPRVIASDGPHTPEPVVDAAACESTSVAAPPPPVRAEEVSTTPAPLALVATVAPSPSPSVDPATRSARAAAAIRYAPVALAILAVGVVAALFRPTDTTRPAAPAREDASLEVAAVEAAGQAPTALQQPDAVAPAPAVSANPAPQAPAPPRTTLVVAALAPPAEPPPVPAAPAPLAPAVEAAAPRDATTKATAASPAGQSSRPAAPVATPVMGAIPAWIRDDEVAVSRGLAAKTAEPPAEEPRIAKAVIVPPAPAAPPRDAAPRVFSPWQRIDEGMTRERVETILGLPRWREITLVQEFWMYETKSILATGVIVFEDGRVSSWREPAWVSAHARNAAAK